MTYAEWRQNENKCASFAEFMKHPLMREAVEVLRDALVPILPYPVQIQSQEIKGKPFRDAGVRHIELCGKHAGLQMLLDMAKCNNPSPVTELSAKTAWMHAEQEYQQKKQKQQRKKP